jgi:hypothetical protein
MSQRCRCCGWLWETEQAHDEHVAHMEMIGLEGHETEY